MAKAIHIVGASTHNLRAVDCEIPRGGLVLVSGPSGSGKSSLIFDTLYPEAVRRVVSPMSGGWWELTARPNVREISGLSFPIPFFGHPHARKYLSCVLNLSGLAEPLASLIYRFGSEHCLNCETPLPQSSLTQFIAEARAFPQAKSLQVLSPLPRESRERVAMVEAALSGGYTRAIVEDSPLPLERMLHGDSLFEDNPCFVYVDAITSGATRGEERLRAAVMLAEKLGAAAVLRVLDGEVLLRELRYSSKLQCPSCGSSQAKMSRESLLVGKRLGACRECGGAGVVLSFDVSRMCDETRAPFDGGIAAWRNAKLRPRADEIQAWKRALKIPEGKPFAALTPKKKAELLFGSAHRETFPVFPSLVSPAELSLEKSGVCGRMYAASLVRGREILRGLVQEVDCPTCEGARFRAEALAYEAFGTSLKHLMRMPLIELEQVLLSQAPDDAHAQILEKIKILLEFGLGYLHLARATRTLSAGEAQRLELARELGRRTRGAMFLLDEPSSGLHPLDLERVVKRLQALAAPENAIVVVDHHERFFSAANTIIHLGPGAGEKGGRIVSPNESPGEETLEEASPVFAAAGKEWIEATGMYFRNLRNVSLRIPLQSLVGVCGVSGSGKSTALFDCLGAALESKFQEKGRGERKGEDGFTEFGIENLRVAETLRRIVMFDLRARTQGSRSQVGVFLGLSKILARLYSMSEEAKILGFSAQDFLGRTARSRCEVCRGKPVSQSLRCVECGGTRLSRVLREISWRGLSFSRALSLTIEELGLKFQRIPKLRAMCEMLAELGLAYLRVSQRVASLSSGEKQRLVLATRLLSPPLRATLFLLDEPCRGLGSAEIRLLENLFRRLIAQGHSVVAIEHRPSFLKQVDYLIEFGPGAGPEGGELVFSGPLSALAEDQNSEMKAFL